MANKTEKTLEQLKVEAELATQAYNLALKAEEQKKKEEAERKKAELAAVKEKRYAEIEEARKVYCKLINDYVRDYGEYSVKNTSDNDEDVSITSLLKSWPWRLFS